MRRSGLAIIAFIAFGVGALSPASAQETPKDIIAAHIRSQGYSCDGPQSAKRDLRASIPEEPVWLLKCKNASYRVRLIPDMAAIVEPID